MSNAFYNKGLALAKSGNMTEAIEALHKSVGLDKKNADARNLLGLVYFNIGHMADALKQWVISSAVKKKDNPAAGYLEEFQKNQRQMEKYADSIRAYNSSIAYLKQKSEDMAIIQLRRALEQNENFCDAMNLLCLCYLVSKQKSKVMPILEKILEIDRGNAIALNYYKEMTRGRVPGAAGFPANRPKTELKRAAVSRVSPLSPVFSLRDSKRPFPFTQLASLVIGALVILIIMFAYAIPSAVSKKQDELTMLQADYNKLQTDSASQISDLQTKYDALDGQNATMTADYNDLEPDFEARDQLLMASYQYNEGNYADAKAILDGILTDKLSTEIMTVFTKLKDDCTAQLAGGSGQ